jgi:hypothetical protein
MLTPDPPHAHIWFTPHQIAVILDGRQRGSQYRAKCPAHDGDNPESLSIREGKDKNNNPCTLLHCFAQGCKVEDICAAMGIPVRCLFAIQEEYGRATRDGLRAHSPRINRLKSLEEPSPDEIAQILLEEMIVSDPAWIQECTPAREKMWELAEASPKARAALTRALREAGFRPTLFWEQLTQDREEHE